MEARKRTGKKIRAVGKILFVLYIIFLVYFLIISDWYGRDQSMEGYRYNLVPFQEINRFWHYREMLGWRGMANLLGNILLFIPFGFFLPMASKYKSFFLTAFFSFGFSLLVESFQLISKVGIFDVDDLLLNALGGILGYLIYMIGRSARRSLNGKKYKG